MLLKEKFVEGGSTFMGFVTILLILATAWIIYYFIRAYSSKGAATEKLLHKMGHGRLLGLFAMATGFLGQLMGLTGMFDAIQMASLNGQEVKPVMIWGALKATMIVPMYGIVIFLFSLMLWFIARIVVDKKMGI